MISFRRWNSSPFSVRFNTTLTICPYRSEQGISTYAPIDSIAIRSSPHIAAADHVPRLIRDREPPQRADRIRRVLHLWALADRRLQPRHKKAQRVDRMVVAVRIAV